MRTTVHKTTQPVLRQHHQHTYEKSCEPEAVGNGAVIHIAVQEETKDETDEDKRANGHERWRTPYLKI